MPSRASAYEILELLEDRRRSRRTGVVLLSRAGPEAGQAHEPENLNGGTADASHRKRVEREARNARGRNRPEHERARVRDEGDDGLDALVRRGRTESLEKRRVDLDRHLERAIKLSWAGAMPSSWASTGAPGSARSAITTVIAVATGDQKRRPPGHPGGLPAIRPLSGTP